MGKRMPSDTKKPAKLPDLMTRAEAARELNITSEWVRRLEMTGVLHALKTAGGRSLFLVADIAAFKAARRKAEKGGKR